MTNQTILPTGFYDLYGEEAKKHFLISNQILTHLTSRNFELFIPTALEFPQQSLGTSKSHNILTSKQFSVHDPLSEGLLAIRNDITPQITRALNYAKSQTPRICYCGDIYRSNTSSSEQRRKFTQAGFEIIKQEPGLAIKETLQELFSLLELLTLSNYKITVTLPQIFHYFAALKTENNQELLAKFINYTNEVNISALKEEFQLDEDILEIIIGTNFAKISDFFNKQPTNSPNFIKLLKDSLGSEFLSNKEVSFNARFDNYHENIAISITSPSSNATYIRAGDYKINERFACGASFYIEEILANYKK